MSSDPVIRFRCTAIRRSGATEIRIIHATSADAARDRLIAAGLEPVSIEAVGPSLTNHLIGQLRERLRDSRGREAPAEAVSVDSRTRSKPMAAIALLLATAGIVLTTACWSLVAITKWQARHVERDRAAAITRYHVLRADERVRSLVRPAMTLPGPTEILGRLAAILPRDAGLAAAGRDGKGGLRIEIDSADPDQIRPIFAGDPIFRTLTETGQSQTGDGRIRVTWTSARP